MTTPNDHTMSHDSLDAVIAAYMLAVEAGDVPNRQELLDQHPEHAEALRGFFADLDRMDRVSAPLRLADDLEATGAADANGHTAVPTVRYFGDYELLEEIARGGMGIVFKARQVSLNRMVALKMILAGSFASSRDVQRFRSEAESAANLDHPHIVPIYEIGEHEGHQYFSMKFVEGTSLAKHPQTDPRGEVEGMITVIRAVHHAHQAAACVAPRSQAVECASGFKGNSARCRLRPGETDCRHRWIVHPDRSGAWHPQIHGSRAGGRSEGPDGGGRRV